MLTFSFLSTMNKEYVINAYFFPLFQGNKKYKYIKTIYRV